MDKADRGRQETIFLPTSSSLRISDWPQVSRSWRVWDQKLSSLLKAPWLRGGLINLWQCSNQNMRAAQQSEGRCCIQSSMGKWSFLGCQAEESLLKMSQGVPLQLIICLETAPIMSRPLVSQGFKVDYWVTTPRKKKKKKEGGNLGAWVTKMDGRERRYMSGVSAVWALSGEMGFVLERGNRKRCIYVKHQRAGWQLVKQMRDRIPEKGKKKNRTVWKK